MAGPPLCDEVLVQRLPLPLAKLYRRAHNAGNPWERHQAALYLWEAALKLLASAALVTYAEGAPPEPAVAEKLKNLSRPSLGHWWEFVKLIVPTLARAGGGPFQPVREFLFGRAQKGLSQLLRLDRELRKECHVDIPGHDKVMLQILFDLLVEYRNRTIGHGAAGMGSDQVHEARGWLILGGVAELLGSLDVLAGGGLVYVRDVRRLKSGAWRVERLQLMGEAPRLLEVDLPAAGGELPWPERVYLETLAGPALRSLHPLVVYDSEKGEVLFLNTSRDELRTEYLCYTTGQVTERRELDGEQQEFLGRVLAGGGGRPAAPAGNHRPPPARAEEGRPGARPRPAVPPRVTGSRRFFYAQVPDKGLLEVDPRMAPYAAVADSTDSTDDEEPSAVFCFPWFPKTRTLLRQLKDFTPVSAICLTDPARVVRLLSARLDARDLAKFGQPPGELVNEEKERLLRAMGAALGEAFVVAVTFPELLLRVGRNNAELAYQAMVNLFLVPLMQAHVRIGIPQFHVRLPDVGDGSAFLLGLAKRVTKASYPKKGTASAEPAAGDAGGALFSGMARLFAWAVSALHNSDNADWVGLLERAVEESGGGASRLEGPPPGMTSHAFCEGDPVR